MMLAQPSQQAALPDVGVLLSAASPSDVTLTWRQIEQDNGGQRDTVTIRRRIIIRIPVMPLAQVPPSSSFNAMPARAERSPACLSLRLVRGAKYTDRDGITFHTMTAPGRYRAQLERGCQAVSFQSGFYMEANPDRMICVGRDMLRSRSGATCVITRFSYLEPGK